jgi:hypothetical protein
MARSFRVTAEVLREAERLGLGGPDAEAIVADMARRGSRITHPSANRRYRNFILLVTPDDVISRIGVMGDDEAGRLDRRTYDERKAAERDGGPGEATVERLTRR